MRVSFGTAKYALSPLSALASCSCSVAFANELDQRIFQFSSSQR